MLPQGQDVWSHNKIFQKFRVYENVWLVFDYQVVNAFQVLMRQPLSAGNWKMSGSNGESFFFM